MRKKNLPPVDLSAVVIVATPAGIVCVRKPERRPEDRRFWQFPGGKRNRKDKSPMITAARECHEEIGVRMDTSSLHMIGSWLEYNHFTHEPFQMYLFIAQLTEEQARRLIRESAEGEEVRVFTWAELNAMGDFSPYHRTMAEKFGAWRAT